MCMYVDTYVCDGDSYISKVLEKIFEEFKPQISRRRTTKFQRAKQILWTLIIKKAAP